jgi:hypothetical protein
MGCVVVPDESPLASFYVNNLGNRSVESVKLEFSGLMHLQSMSHDSVNYSPMTSNHNCAPFMSSNRLSQSAYNPCVKLPDSFPAWKQNFVRV